MDSKIFKTTEILSIICEVLLTSDAKPLADFLLGYKVESIKRFQLNFCKEQLEKQFPQFATEDFKKELAKFLAELEVANDNQSQNEEIVRKWVKEIIIQYGHSHEVRKPSDEVPAEQKGGPISRSVIYAGGNTLVIGRRVTTDGESRECYHPMSYRVTTHRGEHCDLCGKRF